MITAHGKTHPGLIRKSNEDSLACLLDLGMFIVADGMGGHNAGEVASRLAVETFELVVRRTQEPDCTWPFGFDPNRSLSENRLATAIKLANERILSASEAKEAQRGMGTTTVATLIEGDTAWYVSVGDSRLYAYRNGELAQLTRDHTWIAEVLAQDPTRAGEALADNPMRHVLTHVVGVRDQLPIDIASRKLAHSEKLLLCSDGLHGSVSDEAIAATMGAFTDLAEIVDHLIAQALDGGGRDNVTAVVLQYHLDPPANADLPTVR